MSKKTYKIEYWIDPEKFSKIELEKHLEESLGKSYSEFEIEIGEIQSYLSLRIVSTEKNIDSCHDNLKDFDREYAIRLEDELSSDLRAKAYLVLADIELWLRNFINKAMIEVNGINWWDSLSIGKIRENVQKIEAKIGSSQVKLYHPIELTFFDDLIGIITAEFQEWPDNKPIDVVTLQEILTAGDSIKDVREELNRRRRKISFWDDVFSDYFNDKDTWDKLKATIKKHVVPARNKVMHHRLLRCYEYEKVKHFRDELREVLNRAKPKLSETELKEAQISFELLQEQMKRLQEQSFTDLISPSTRKMMEDVRKQSFTDLISPSTRKMMEDVRKQSFTDLISPSTRKMMEDVRKQSFTDLISPSTRKIMEQMSDHSSNLSEQGSKSDEPIQNQLNPKRKTRKDEASSQNLGELLTRKSITGNSEEINDEASNTDEKNQDKSFTTDS